MQARGHDQERSGGVLLTGATGFVGMELLTRFLARRRAAVRPAAAPTGTEVYA